MMSKRAVGLPWLALACAGLFAAPIHAGEAWQPPRVVTVQGVEKCYNYSRSFGLWGVLPKKGRPGRLLVRDGDILALRHVKDKKNKDKKNDEPVFMPYREGDGTSLVFDYDGHRLTLAGKTVALRLAKDKAGWQWLDAATHDELASLRFLTLEDELGEAGLTVLTKLAAVNRNVDLALEEKVWARVLPLFTPQRLILADKVTTKEPHQKLLRSQVRLETLWVQLDEPEELDFVEALPNLRRLVIMDWKPTLPAALPPACQRLESLAIIDSNIEDLFAIEELTGLRELHLRDCESLSDIRSLARLPQLRVLTLSCSEKITDLSPVGKLPNLTWLTLAWKIKQKQFAAVCGSVPRLGTLELIGTEEVKDLCPLDDLRELRHLTLLGPQADTAPLQQMKGLRLLILPDEMFEKAAVEVAALQKALPECAMAEGRLCLGSGWILLLVPALGLGWLWAKRRRMRQGVRHA